MTQKISITKPGFDAVTEANPDHLVFSSDYNTLKYYASGNYQMLNVTTTTNITIAHNLGYVPFHIVYVNDFVSQPAQYAITEYFNSSGARNRAARAYCDANNLYLSLNLAAGAPITVNWYYKLFLNNLSL